ncbi:hypothetical protein FPZ24_13385 [Sphingomonas panacisoli]|uniref:Uncharacterized protein n=1 Tax=Sphingomonas panacisoli TaxID=1813879 RepID=A0A5B8LJ86_9SPHN|nr:hypothetical protein [Sphingomonas panacisoli]QDZ08347.1 hypothetical protein FPZ24_13385 [Sphingomonas panacisoli]
MTVSWILFALLSGAPTGSTRPAWLLGDWCYPLGHPLRLTSTDGLDGDETTTYSADGRWRDLGTGGTWRVSGRTLIERRDYAEPGFLGAGEPLRQTWRIRFVRHGRYAMSLSGDRRGWLVKCPGQ